MNCFRARARRVDGRSERLRGRRVPRVAGARRRGRWCCTGAETNAAGRDGPSGAAWSRESACSRLICADARGVPLVELLVFGQSLAAFASLSQRSNRSAAAARAKLPSSTRKNRTHREIRSVVHVATPEPPEDRARRSRCRALPAHRQRSHHAGRKRRSPSSSLRY